MSDKELIALISLLDDPDERVISMVVKNLIDKGMDVVPTLEKAWEDSMNEVFQERLVNIIQDIQFKSVRSDFSKWVNNETDNLLKGAYILAKHQYPDIKYEDYQELINKMSRDIWIELNDNLTALEKVKIINHIIFDVYGFSVNTTNIFSTQNNYINQVFETKKGNAITISIIYITIANRLDLPIYGVNLPNNFIMAYQDRYDYGNLFRDNILFYIDPISIGRALGRKEIDYFLQRIKVTPQESFYLPCDNIKIMQRLLSNLIISYDKENQKEKIEQLKELFTILSSHNIE